MIGVTLITNNTREFRQIKDLKVVDWTSLTGKGRKLSDALDARLVIELQTKKS